MGLSLDEHLLVVLVMRDCGAGSHIESRSRMFVGLLITSCIQRKVCSCHGILDYRQYGCVGMCMSIGVVGKCWQTMACFYD